MDIPIIIQELSLPLLLIFCFYVMYLALKDDGSMIQKDVRENYEKYRKEMLVGEDL